ncbi:Sporulation related domain-containing protein [Burkholderia sp. YR290]|nr:Sporulation related domain-containing protein [Burkholderia sp. YR290]
MAIRTDASKGNDSVGGTKRFLIAGVGGIAPILVSLAAVDLETLLFKITVIATLAYAIKVLVLYAIGGFVGWLHSSENDMRKLFQLGIVAPALITTALNGGRVPVPKAPEPMRDNPSVRESSRPATGSNWTVLSPAYAEETELKSTDGSTMKGSVKQWSLPYETPVQQLKRGLFGSLPDNVYFVVAGSDATQEGAERLADDIRKRGFDANVYEPYRGNSYYAVVIGAQLTLQQARDLRERARLKGLPSDTYIWTYPQGDPR